MKEIWKDIENFEGIYRVSNLGKIKSLKYGKEKILSLTKNSKGYLRIMLFKNRKTSQKLVSRLVAKAFIPNPENKRTVNHKKGIITDNRALELEWATYSENHLHAYKVLGRYHQTGRDNPRNKPVLQIDSEGHIINKYFSQAQAAKQTGIAQASISAVCLNKRKDTNGYKWKFDKNRLFL